MSTLVGGGRARPSWRTTSTDIGVLRLEATPTSRDCRHARPDRAATLGWAGPAALADNVDAGGHTPLAGPGRSTSTNAGRVGLARSTVPADDTGKRTPMADSGRPALTSTSAVVVGGGNIGPASAHTSTNLGLSTSDSGSKYKSIAMLGIRRDVVHPRASGTDGDCSRP